VKISNTADNAGITLSQARDTRYRRKQELNSLLVSKYVNSYVPVEYAGGKRSFRVYIAVCFQIHCNPSSCNMCVSDRQKLMDDYRKQALVLFQQWESDLEKIRENEEKLQVIPAFGLVNNMLLRCIIMVLSFSVLTLLVG